MIDRSAFYGRRDARTAEVVPELERAAETPVGLAVTHDIASTPEGQQFVLAAVNMLVRFHRRVHLDVPLVGLEVPSLSGGSDLLTASVSLAKAIDPFIEINGVEPPRHWLTAGDVRLRTGQPTLAVGWGGWSGAVAPGASSLTTEPGTPGACAAACLGAAGLFRASLGLPLRADAFSLWTLRHGDDQERGPAAFEPIAFQNVLQIGGGGVGASFLYWLNIAGRTGTWTVVDPETVEVSNLNRCLPFLAADAGAIVPAASAKQKVDVLAERYGIQPHADWFMQAPLALIEDADLVLPLADQGGIRRQVSLSGKNYLAHATTDGGSWEAQAHRHVRGKDDCPACRVPDKSAAPAFPCSQGSVASGSVKFDASLPFLSAGAALMLLAQLGHLQGGRIPTPNIYRWRFDGRNPARPGRHGCRAGCDSAELVRHLDAVVRGDHTGGTQAD
ncbi:MAG: ThiF family adenylyltransferase [Phycisphaeraceae bacterium]|nr:ThiF family adenylyltransferase [Phycisphaeraceae bacterium]